MNNCTIKRFKKGLIPFRGEVGSSIKWVVTSKPFICSSVLIVYTLVATSIIAHVVNPPEERGLILESIFYSFLAALGSLLTYSLYRVIRYSINRACELGGDK